jgi:hypothetical protein
MKRKKKKPIRSDTQVTGPVPLDIPKEIDYIIARARNADARVVGFGTLVSFSTAAGDVWLLDWEDGFALRLAKEGTRLPVRVVDSQGRFAVEFDHDYELDAEHFTYRERKSGKITTTLGEEYAVIAKMIANQRKAHPGLGG